MTVQTMHPGTPQGAFRNFEFVRDRKPRTFQVVVLAIMLPLVFSVGRYIPGFGWTIELGIALSIILAAISVMGAKPKGPNPFNIYLMLVAFGLPVLSALGSYIAFQQPIWLGLLAQRGCLFALFAYAISNLLSDGRLTIPEFQRALIILAWVNLAICSLVVTMLDPNDYSPIGGLVTDGGGIYNEFVIPIIFIIFGLIYYFSKWVIGGRAIYGILAAPFFLYMVGANGGRSAILAMLTAMAIITWIGSPNKRFSNVFGGIILAAGSLLLVEAALPGTMDQFYAAFGDAFSVILGAQQVADVSANVRIIEAQIAWPYVADNPILGTGTISNQWNGGYAAMFGYFHPADLGLLGLAFTYGFVGLLFFGIQYVMLIRSFSQVSALIGRVPGSDMLLTTMALLTFLLSSSLATGLFIINPEQTLLIFVLLQAQIRRHYFAN